MLSALTATAKKLASRPDFMEQYRQRFPHIVASTERLLASVEKQPPPGRPAGQGPLQAAAGPMAALAAAHATAVAADQRQLQVAAQQHGVGELSRLGREAAAADLWPGGREGQEEEESTMQLYSQVCLARPD